MLMPILIDPFHANVPFLYLMETSENFWWFSGPIEIGHRHEKG